MYGLPDQTCLAALLGAGLLVLLVNCSVVSGQTGPDGGHYLDRVFTALERALRFFDQEHTRVNLDAIIGTRIVEGQLSVLLRHVNSPDGPDVSPRVLQQIQSIQNMADRVSKVATPYIEKNQPEYYARIGPILDQGFWTLDYPSVDVDRRRLSRTLYQGEAMHEEDSDDCLTEIFGTSGKSQKTCQISQRCWDLMTSPGYRGYSLSHEVFYLEIAEMFGCFDARSRAAAASLSTGFCTNMLQEATEIAHQGYPEDRRDLFMELPALCGMLGYRQFFRDVWLERILSWQHPRGCWGVTAHVKSGRQRFKREEKELPDGCQCHRTAVAIGALAEYVRYILEYIQLTGHKHMR